MNNQRIISICPSNTEILYQLGLIDQVIAVDDYSDWPPEHVEHLPKVGPDLNVDMEKVASFQPDLVIASLSVPGMEKNVEKLEQLGIPHIVLNPKTIEDIFVDIRLVAEATGKEERAEVVIQELQERLDRIRLKIQKRTSTPRLYWEWWPRPFIAPAGGNWLTPLSAIAGAENIFSDRPGDSVIDPTGEEVVAGNPDYILAVWCGVHSNKVDPQKILTREGWQETPAIQNRHVHVLEEGLYCRPSPRLFDGLEELVDLIHPDLRNE